MEVPNIDMLIKKPFLFLYLHKRLLKLAQRQGGIWDTDGQGFDTFFTRIPELDKFSDFLETHVPVKISVQKFPKFDDTVKMIAINLKGGATKELTIEDLDKILNFDNVIYKKFEQCKSLDEVPRVKLYLGKKFIPEFLYKVILPDEETVEKKTLSENSEIFQLVSEILAFKGTDIMRLKKFIPRLFKYLLKNKMIRKQEVEDAIPMMNVQASQERIQKRLATWKTILPKLQLYSKRSNIVLKKSEDLQFALSMLALMKTRAKKSNKVVPELLELITDMLDYIAKVPINKRKKFIVAFILQKLSAQSDPLEIVRAITDSKLDLLTGDIIKVILHRLLIVALTFFKPRSLNECIKNVNDKTIEFFTKSINDVLRNVFQHSKDHDLAIKQTIEILEKRKIDPKIIDSAKMILDGVKNLKPSVQIDLSPLKSQIIEIAKKICQTPEDTYDELVILSGEYLSKIALREEIDKDKFSDLID